ncbi:LysM peptidoglycan-binding domain-containing protein [Sporosarcina sp. G11-34]|uniref:LysM peptidoglycan-binding domain-containing protein n=1 Tax=Sporosarcina sp. G11-34 TaxID=2849605 RepID=UPI0022A93041|nr:LysM peptidoglycan-binding domain-containing protein [Sporosarcina sp. G11-34]
MFTIQLFYEARANDTVNDIAKRWGLPVESIIASNNLVPPYTIFAGQQLSIPPGVNTYRVESADSVYRISQLYGVPSSVIIEANQLKPPYMLQIGQLVKVPQGVPHYLIQSEDTLDQIAKRYNVSAERIQEANRLSTSTIHTGMKLTIPSGSFEKRGFIAYTSNRGGQYDIWVYNLGNGEKRQLTNGLGDSFSSPVWSPDSSRIAFVGKDEVIYVVYVEDGLIAGIDQLDAGGDFHLDWSPDSSTVAYTARGIIMLYNATLHTAQSVEQPGATTVSWFPSGTELLFQAVDPSGISQLYRCQMTGSDKVQITKNTTGPLHNAELSPDGKFALYTTPGASVSIIQTVDVSTGHVVEVEGGPLSKNYFPKWSPDSLQIAYSATAFEDAGYFSQIRTVERLGENDRIWAISNCFQTPVTWSSDGSKIAYLSGCAEHEFAQEMWIIDLNHPVPIQLLGGESIMSLEWAPTAVLDLAKREFTSEILDVNFQYPADWKKVTDEKYEGSDGFFRVSALLGSDNIEEVCHAEAFQKSMPYGSQPQVIKNSTLYEQSCTILPSSDQATEMNNQAAYIVKYPSPIIIEGINYNYFILWADKNHIEEISSTIMFLP